MKKTLSAERLRDLLNYDPETGVFTWRALTSPKSRVVIGSVAGCFAVDYWVINVDGKQYGAHVLAWLHVHGAWPEKGIDHRDTIKHHNWIDNLRPATQSENMQNRRVANRNNKSGLLGVSWNERTQQWDAFIKVNRKSKNLGGFGDPHDAHLAYLAAKAIHHPFSTIGHMA